jgi:hypothetical protein
MEMYRVTYLTVNLFIYLFAIHVRKLPIQRRTVRMAGDNKMPGMWKEAVVAFVGPVPAFPWNK